MADMGAHQPFQGTPRNELSILQNKWTVALLLSFGLAMDYQARVAINSVFPLLRKDLLMTDIQIGLTATVFLWIYGLLSPLAGYLGDRFPRRTVLIGSVACWNVVTLLSGFATSPWQIISMRVILATAQVCYMPAAQALITDFHGEQTQGKAIGIFQAGCYVGIFLAGLPTAYVSEHLGWRMMFRLSGGIGLLLAGLMLALPRRQAGEPRAASGNDGRSSPVSVRAALSLFRIPSILAIMLAFALASGANWLFFTYLPLFIYERHRLSLAGAAFLATFYMQIAGMTANPLLGHVADKWAAKRAKNRFLFCALAALAGLPALVAVGFGNHIPILIAGLVLFGMVCAAADVSWMPMLSYVTCKRQRATAFGYLNMAACLSGGLTAMIAALTMSRFGLGLLIASGGLMFVLLSVVLLVAAELFLARDFVPEGAGDPVRQDPTPSAVSEP